jgi:N-acetylmuramic acid 6-phosphate etherase
MSGSTRQVLLSPEVAGPVDLGSMTALEIATAALAADRATGAAIEPELVRMAAAIEAIAERLAAGGRLVLVGAGTSGRLALMEAAEIGPTFGVETGVVVGILAGVGTSTDPGNPIATPESAEDDAPAGRAAMDGHAVGPADAVVGISASGQTGFTVAALDRASSRGAFTISLACAHPSALADAAGLAIHPLVGPELLSGSTRLAAATATKVVLDILTTGAMVRLGRVHGGRMIDVRASNAKLRERAVGIVADLTARPRDEARASLEAVGWWPRAAILRLELGLEPLRARSHARNHRFLADALADRLPEPLASEDPTRTPGGGPTTTGRPDQRRR